MPGGSPPFPGTPQGLHDPEQDLYDRRQSIARVPVSDAAAETLTRVDDADMLLSSEDTVFSVSMGHLRRVLRAGGM
jgi:hypothetical protein